MLKLKEVPYTEKNGLEKFVQCRANDPDATLRIGTQYYRLPKENDKDFVSIEVGLKEGELVQESYYLSIQTQFGENDSTVYNFVIQCNSRLKNPDGKTGLPTTWVPYNPLANNKDYVKNGSENRVVISDFFTQDMTLNTEGSVPVMSSENKSIQGNLAGTVTFRSNDGYDIFVGQRDGRKLQQQFCLTLRNQDNIAVPFPAGTTITIGNETLPVEPGYSYWLPAAAVTNWTNNGTTMESPIPPVSFTLHFTEEGILETLSLIHI